jgi:hypothetical protein
VSHSVCGSQTVSLPKERTGSTNHSHPILPLTSGRPLETHARPRARGRTCSGSSSGTGQPCQAYAGGPRRRLPQSQRWRGLWGTLRRCKCSSASRGPPCPSPHMRCLLSFGSRAWLCLKLEDLSVPGGCHVCSEASSNRLQLPRGCPPLPAAWQPQEACGAPQAPPPPSRMHLLGAMLRGAGLQSPCQ